MESINPRHLPLLPNQPQSPDQPTLPKVIRVDLSEAERMLILTAFNIATAFTARIYGDVPFDDLDVKMLEMYSTCHAESLALMRRLTADKRANL